MSKTTTSPEMTAGSAHERQQAQDQPRPQPVTELVLWLAEDCPVGCAVCYARPGPRIMSPETARAALDWLCREEVSGQETSLIVELTGREPLLAWDTIQDLLEWWPKSRRKRGKKVSFQLHSPGAACDQEKSARLKELATAMKGTLEWSAGHRNETLPWQECSPLNPVALPGSSAPSWRRLPISPRDLDLKSQVLAALDQGATEIFFAPNVREDWGVRRDTMKILRSAWRELAEHYVEEARHGRLPPLESTHALLNLIHRKKQGEEVARPENPCLQTSHRLLVDPDGNLMACHHWLPHSFWWLGNLTEGIYEVRRKSLIEYQRIHFQPCQKCTAYEVCPGPCLGQMQSTPMDFGDPLPGHCFFLRAHHDTAQWLYATLMLEENSAFMKMLGAKKSGTTKMLGAQSMPETPGKGRPS